MTDPSPSADPTEEWIQEILRDELDRDYVVELCRLQAELLKLQSHVMARGMRIAILFEGRDTAGKGGAILRFSQRLRPRHFRTVALQKPTKAEQGQWFFERYVRQLPDPGELVFFDRSWYNRAVVEPVMNFCTEAQYQRFMEQVVPFEEMLVDDGLLLIKLWFSIDREEQKRRIDSRRKSPLKMWKLSPVDEQAQRYWDEFTARKLAMFERTSTDKSPWLIVEGNSKKAARLETIRHVLRSVDYENAGQPGLRLDPDRRIVFRAGSEAPVEGIGG